MHIGTQLKDPDGQAAIVIDWTAHIGGDTISSSQWFMPTGITAEGAPGLAGNVATQQVSGGQEGADYIITNRVTLSSGVIVDATVLLKIRTGAEDPRIG